MINRLLKWHVDIKTQHSNRGWTSVALESLCADLYPILRRTFLKEHLSSSLITFSLSPAWCTGSAWARRVRACAGLFIPKSESKIFLVKVMLEFINNRMEINCRQARCLAWSKRQKRSSCLALKYVIFSPTPYSASSAPSEQKGSTPWRHPWNRGIGTKATKAYMLLAGIWILWLLLEAAVKTATDKQSNNYSTPHFLVL